MYIHPQKKCLGTVYSYVHVVLQNMFSAIEVEYD